MASITPTGWQTETGPAGTGAVGQAATDHHPDRRRSALQIAWGGAVAFALSATAMALVLLARRGVGAFAHPLPTPAMIGLACVLVTTSSALRWYVGRACPQDIRWPEPVVGWLRQVCWWAPTCVGACLALAVTVPRVSPLALGIFWAAVLLQELWAGVAWWHGAATERRRANTLATYPTDDVTESAIEPLAAAEPDEASDGYEESFVFPRGVTQQITRFHTDEGQDILTAIVRAQFAAGCRQQTLHVAFCPPFVQLPELNVQEIDGPAVSLKTVQLLHQGARVDVRRRGTCDEPCDVLIEMTAMADLPPVTQDA